MPWATANQTAAMPRKTAAKKEAIGPRPVRTARGAGRRLRVGPLPRAGFRAGFRFLLDAVRLRFRVLLARASEGVLLLREPGGEDVRVATPPTLGNRHSSHTHHTNACRESGFTTFVGWTGSPASFAERRPSSGVGPDVRLLIP